MGIHDATTNSNISTSVVATTIDAPPVVTAVPSVSLGEGQSISASLLIASISNPSGDAIANDIFEDFGGGSGYFTVNGVRQPDGVWISAASSENVQYVAGSSPGSDTLGVGIHDATTNSNFSSSVIATTIPPPIAAGDAFDILFQNVSGQAAIWDVTGASLTTSALLGANPGPNWKDVAISNFGADTHPDILLQNINGAVVIWQTDGASVTSSTVVSNPGAKWKAVGTGDFGDNGQSDILLQNTSGAVAIWNMNGTTLESSAAVSNPGPNWKVVGTGDFTGDGHSDGILLQNTNGNVAIWEMNGTAIKSSTVVANPGAGWHAIGTGDFNGDSHSDILLQNTNGAVAVWELNANGTEIMSSAALANPGTSLACARDERGFRHPPPEHQRSNRALGGERDPMDREQRRQRQRGAKLASGRARLAVTLKPAAYRLGRKSIRAASA